MAGCVDGNIRQLVLQVSRAVEALGSKVSPCGVESGFVAVTAPPLCHCGLDP